MVLSPQKDKLVVGSNLGVQVYQMDPFKELWFGPFESGVVAVDFSPSNNLIAIKSGGPERTVVPEDGIHLVILLDATTGNRVGGWEEHESFGEGLSKIAFSPDGTQLISGRWSDSVVIRDLSTGWERTLNQYASIGILKTDFVSGIAWTPAGNQIAFDSIALDYPVVLIDAGSGKLMVSMDQLPRDSIWTGARTLVFNSDGTFLAGDLQFKVAIWNSVSGREVESFTLPNGTIRGPFALSVAFSPDDTLLASGWDNGAIVVWNVKTGEVVKTLQEAGEAVNTVLFYGNDRIITQSASEIKVWDLATGKGTTYLGGSAPVP